MKNRILVLGLLFFTYLSFIQYNRIVVVMSLAAIYLLIYKDVYVLIVLVFLLFNYQSPYVYEYNDGYVTAIKTNSIVVSNNHQNVLITADTTVFNLDDYVSFDGQAKPLIKDSSFYNFDYSSYLYTQNIYSSIYKPTINVVDKSNSIRGYVYSYIKKMDDSIIKNFYLKFFYKINSFSEEDLFMQIGLPYYGLIIVITSAFKYFFKKNIIYCIKLLLLIALGILFGFNFIVYRLLISTIVTRYVKDTLIRFNIIFILLMVLFPSMVNTVSFIYPIIFRFLSCFNNTKSKAHGYLVSSLIQGLFFLKVNIVNVFLYKYLIKWYGFIMLLLFISLVNPSLFNGLFEVVYKFQNIIESSFISISGKPNVIVFIFLIVLFYMKINIKIILVLYLIIMNFNLYRISYEVSFINIGQGDSILITSPFNNEVVLVDTGKQSEYRRLYSYLIGSGINEIDYVIISHSDEDHNGSLNDLLEDFKVKEVITSSKDINTLNTKLYSLNKQADGSDNNNSLIYYFNIKDLKFLLTGDMDKSVEQWLIDQYDIDVDILKVAHHGSKTSTSIDFIDNIMPSLSIISTNGQYNHPHSEVIDTLEKTKTNYLITKNSGDIKIVINKIVNLVHTSSQEFGIIN